MTFRPEELRVFDRAGVPIGTITGWSVTGPRTYRLNDVEDFAFSIPRNNATLPIIGSAYSDPPTLVGVTQREKPSADKMWLPNPKGVQSGDMLVAAIAFDRNGSSTRNVGPPSGWTPVDMVLNGTDHGLRVHIKRVLPGDPTSRVFTTGAPAAMAGILTVWRGVQRLRVHGTESVLGKDFISSPMLPIGGSLPNSLRLNVVASDRSAVFTHQGATKRAGLAVPNLGLGVGSRLLSATGDATRDVIHSSVTADLVAASLIFEPRYGTAQLLQRDNMVFLDNDIPSMPGWAGYIDDVLFAESTADVRCLGTLGLLGRLTTTTIEQEEGWASTVAQRLVAAANAKKAAHGDLQIKFSPDASKRLFGSYRYEGDVLRGLQSLATDTLSEFYMHNQIVNGRLVPTLHWGAEYRWDRTGVTTASGAKLALKDGVGGNLTPGTEVSFTGTERVNYGRLVGTRTDTASHVDYPSVANVITEVIPVATVTIPESDMPGARRREALDLSVNWGYTKAEQKALALYAQKQYVERYKSFLFAYHQRWGAPFLEGFEWSGPEAEEFRKMSLRNYRTVSRLGRIGDREPIVKWDPDSDADVSLTGWHYKRKFDTGLVRGIAFDFSEPRHRWQALNNYEGIPQAVVSIRARPDYGVRPDSVFRAALTGEQIMGIATDQTEPTSLWILSRSSRWSIVRRWDIESHSPVASWVSPDLRIVDIAVNVAEGLLWSVREDGHVLQKHDLNNGTVLLPRFQTTVYDSVGLSASGDFAYIAGRDGRIEIRYLEDGAYAGVKEVRQEGPLSGIFVDPENTEVWLIKPDRTVSVYSAAIAVEEAGSGGAVDGAPNFGQISGGTYVKVVLSDDRSIGSPDDYPEGNHIIPVEHRNQFGRYVNGKWKYWPPSHIKGKDYQLKNSNCMPAAGAMLLDRHTFGRVQVTPPVMREKMGDTVGATGFAELDKAWKRLGYDLHYSHDGRWGDVLDRLHEGRGVVTAGDSDQIPDRYKCSDTNDGDHALYIHQINEDGQMVVHDPICRHKKRIPAEYIKKYCQKYSDMKGRADTAWSRDTTGKKRSERNKGRAQSLFVVWSKGKWDIEYVPGAIGEPLQRQRTWDPGEQKKGFKERSKVHIVGVEQVIQGEEGRVDEWDPVSMGYGKKGRSYYRTLDGDAMYSDGWYLSPWDVPLSEFAYIGGTANQDIEGRIPEWDNGKAYLANMLEKFNREQGQQVLGIVNREGIWGWIHLGGVYTLRVSLQGPYPSGITGRVRVVAYSPDETSGVLQVQAEWLG